MSNLIEILRNRPRYDHHKLCQKIMVEAADRIAELEAEVTRLHNREWFNTEYVDNLKAENEQQRLEILYLTDRIDELERCIKLMTTALEELNNEED